MASNNNRPLSSKSKQIVYSVSGCFLKIKKGTFRTPIFERTAEATGVIRIIAARIRREKSERGRFSSPTEAKWEPYKCVESFDKAAIRHNTNNSTL